MPMNEDQVDEYLDAAVYSWATNILLRFGPHRLKGNYDFFTIALGCAMHKRSLLQEYS